MTEPRKAVTTVVLIIRMKDDNDWVSWAPSSLNEKRYRQWFPNYNYGVTLQIVNVNAIQGFPEKSVNYSQD